MIVTGLKWWKVNIGSGNGLVPSGNKPLPEPVLTQIYVTTWRHGSNCVTHCRLKMSQNFMIFGSSNVLVPNTDLLSTGPSRTKFSSYWKQKIRLLFNKMHLENSLGPSDAIWWHKSGSTLAQAMACCLMAPNHYLHQCWLITSMVQWQSPKGYFTLNTSAINY